VVGGGTLTTADDTLTVDKRT
jgi:hypothetical protein